MKLRDVAIGWTPSAVRPGPAGPPVKCGSPGIWQTDYLLSFGGDKAWRDLTSDERLRQFLILFAVLVARDGLPPADVFRCFAAVDEFAAAMPSDLPLQKWGQPMTHNDLCRVLRAVVA